MIIRRGAVDVPADLPTLLSGLVAFREVEPGVFEPVPLTVLGEALRVVAADVTPRGTTAERDAYYPAPDGGDMWDNTTVGYRQVYDAAAGSWVKDLQATGGAAHVFASANDSDGVTPSDATVLDFKALYVGTGGTVIIKHTESGAIKTFTNVQDGSILPVAGVRVMAATTASGILALRW